MSEFIAVRTGLEIALTPEILSTLKRDALLVNRIAIPNISTVASYSPRRAGQREVVDELSWLLEKGIIFETPSLRDIGFAMLDRGFHDEIVEILDRQKDLADRSLIVGTAEFKDNMTKLLQWQIALARLSAAYLREIENLDACMWSHYLPAESICSSSNVMAVILKNLPIPDEHTPWEQILEYRSDPDSRSKFLALRNWTSDIAKANLSRHEVEDKVDYLLDQYSRHMSLHKMKTTTGTFETILVTTAELLENLVTIRWSKAAKVLFSIKQRQIDLMAAEQSAPGREVAFIRRAQETFSG